MMNKTLGMAAFLALCWAASPLAGAEDARPFQLVYQSDTRGYYRPCG